MADNTIKFKILRKSLENLSWTIPLISGIILLVSLITPAGYLNYLQYYFSPWTYIIDLKSIRFWMWGYWNFTDYSYDINRSYSAWLSPLHLSIGIIFSAMILTIGLLCIILANRLIRKRSNFEQIGKLSSNCGLLLLVICISWVILISFVPYYDILATVYEYLPDPEYINALFWAYFKPDFGIIGPFVSSSLLIIMGRFAKR